MALFCHDAAHRQVFISNKKNEWLSRIVGDAVVGLSSGWWMNKHTRHHANPNKLGKDGDIAPGALVFTAQDATARTGGSAWWMARQHLFFFPILLLAGLDLHLNAVKGVLGATSMRYRAVEGGLLVLRLVGFPALVLIACGPLMGSAFLAVQVGVFGFLMGGSFAPNHKGMTILPHDADVDFLRRQTLTSRNISGGMPVATLMGGLNYQIEHHLFPSMPSIHLARARRIVRRFCAERSIEYTETTLLGSYRIVLGYLKRVGLRYSDPFACPVAARFR